MASAASLLQFHVLAAFWSPSELFAWQQRELSLSLHSPPPTFISFFLKSFLIPTSCLWDVSQGVSPAELFYLFGTKQAFWLGEHVMFGHRASETHPNQRNVIGSVASCLGKRVMDEA